MFKHPIYDFLTTKNLNGFNDNTVKWNFQKYLINSKGESEQVISPQTSPFDLTKLALQGFHYCFVFSSNILNPWTFLGASFPFSTVLECPRRARSTNRSSGRRISFVSFLERPVRLAGLSLPFWSSLDSGCRQSEFEHCIERYCMYINSAAGFWSSCWSWIPIGTRFSHRPSCEHTAAQPRVFLRTGIVR